MKQSKDRVTHAPVSNRLSYKIGVIFYEPISGYVYVYGILTIAIVWFFLDHTLLLIKQNQFFIVRNKDIVLNYSDMHHFVLLVY